MSHGCQCGVTTPAECTCGAYRSVMRAWLDRRAPTEWAGIDGADDSDFARITWRDFEREPCSCESRGYIVVQCEGQPGYRMVRCARCNAPGSAMVATGTTKGEDSGNGQQD